MEAENTKFLAFEPLCRHTGLLRPSSGGRQASTDEATNGRAALAREFLLFRLPVIPFFLR